MLVTSTPQCFNRTPKLLATTPFPIPEITPPVIKIYFISFISETGMIFKHLFFPLAVEK